MGTIHVCIAIVYIIIIPCSVEYTNIIIVGKMSMSEKSLSDEETVFEYNVFKINSCCCTFSVPNT